MTLRAQLAIRGALSDVYAFVRSREANKKLANVSVLDLIEEAIQRNGTSEDAARFATSSEETPEENTPASQTPLNSANFVSGTSINQPTKLDVITALQSELDGLIDEIKSIEPVDLLDPADSTEEDPITTAENFEERVLGEGT